MSSKTKRIHHTVSHFGFDAARLSHNLGFAAMTAAAVLSLVEIEHFRTERIAVMQPVYVPVAASPADHLGGADLFRRGEKEESPHGMVSYGTTMRSHATSGRR